MEQDFPGPVAEDINVVIAEGATNAQIWVVPSAAASSAAAAASSHSNTTAISNISSTTTTTTTSSTTIIDPELRQVEVVRRDNPTQAYNINTAVAPRPLSHGDLQWGHVYRGYILPRWQQQQQQQQHDPVFLEPKPPNQLATSAGQPAVPLVEVIIKRLDRAVVEWELQHGSAENPMMEIFRMQEIGDDQHVLGIIEALQNDQYLYIISRFCEKGSLADHCPLHSNYYYHYYPEPNLHTEGRARFYFRQMLEAVQYIHDNDDAHPPHGGICHRDIDPGNFLVTNQDRVLLNDFAMSFRIPQGGIVRPMGRCGKPPYWPPEIFLNNQAFYAHQIDIWACVVSLFNLLTGERPYLLPHPGDIGFRYCVLAGGAFSFVSSEENSNHHERLMDVLQDMNYTADTFYPPDISDHARGQISFRETLALCSLVPKIMAMSPQVRELFHNCLRMNPNDRWTMDQIRNCEWMTMELPE